MIEGRGERATGTPNTTYDLASVLFHALEGGASYDRLIRDAEEAGDGELAGFFRRVRDEDGNRAGEARRLLAGRTPAQRGERTTTSVPPRPVPSDDFPGTEPITEETPSRAVEREAATRTPGGARTEEAPMAEEISSGIPSQAPPGDVRGERGTGEDEGLVERARDYLLGEGRESDYPPTEDRER